MGKRTSLLLSIPSPPLGTAQTNSPPNTTHTYLSIQTISLSAAEPNPNTSIPSIVTLILADYSEEESGGSITIALKHLPTSFSLPWSHLKSHSPLPPLPSLSLTSTTLFSTFIKWSHQIYRCSASQLCEDSASCRPAARQRL
jgi:hypothetical protein